MGIICLTKKPQFSKGKAHILSLNRPIYIALIFERSVLLSLFIFLNPNILE